MKTCIRCGSQEFNKKGDCKPCANMRSKAYHVKHREQLLAKMAKRKENNPEKIKIERANSYAKNPDKAKIDSATWYLKNHDKAIETRNIWRKENPLIKKASDARWAKENPEMVKKNKLRYYENNPDCHRIAKHKRRARKIGNGGTLSRGISKKLFILQKGICACGCRQLLGSDYHLDHRMPLSLGGSNTDDNVQLLTSTCNLQKGAKHPIDFMQSRGFLL